MISNDRIRGDILPKIQEQSRILFYYLTYNLIDNKEKEVIKELRKFQNEDGGFGNGLEGDIRMPGSNVASTDLAVSILEELYDEKLKKPVIQEIVSYYERVFDYKKEAFEMVPKESDNYPHAVWWNYDSLDSFTYGNPNPEIIGFLYQYRQYLTTFNINKNINKVVSYILTDYEKEASMHSLISVLKFYNRVDKDVRNLIRDKIQEVTNKLVETDPNKWGEYSLEPYKVAVVAKRFLSTKQEALAANLQYILKNLDNGLPQPNWNWYQYDEEFEKVKGDWVGYLTFEVCKALRIDRKQ